MRITAASGSVLRRFLRAIDCRPVGLTIILRRSGSRSLIFFEQAGDGGGYATHGCSKDSQQSTYDQLVGVRFIYIFDDISQDFPGQENSSKTKSTKLGLTFLIKVSTKVKNLITNRTHVCTCLPPRFHRSSSSVFVPGALSNCTVQLKSAFT